MIYVRKSVITSRLDSYTAFSAGVRSSNVGGPVPAAPRLIFFRLPTLRADCESNLNQLLQHYLNTVSLPDYGTKSHTMLCLRCRALPSIRAPLSNTRTPMNR